MPSRINWGQVSVFQQTKMHRLLAKAAALVMMPLLTVGACTNAGASDRVSPATAAPQPMALTVAELDRVTAAGVSVDIETLAFATGQFGQTETDLVTGVVSRGPLVLGYGFGSGEAVACCGPDAEVRLDTIATGTGSYVFEDTFTAYANNGGVKSGITNGLVLALSGLPRDVLAAATQHYISKISVPPSSYSYHPSVEFPSPQLAD